ncbi:TPA: diaminopropionate ammonia-lyase [Pseudomonas aeruginosa]
MTARRQVAFRINPHRRPFNPDGLAFLSEQVARSVRQFHAGLPGYQPTPLHALPALSKALGVGSVFVKDESLRFGLNAFKGLGGSYAIAMYISKQLLGRDTVCTYAELTSATVRERIGELTFVTATDGNHGRGVAWTAQQLGVKAIVYMPEGSSPVRAENIRSHGAQCTITEHNYDDTVRLAAEAAETQGWVLLQDTAWPGYETIPAWIMQGYLTLASETYEKLQEAGAGQPTHVFLQAGVGSFAAAIMGYCLSSARGEMPRIAIVEPDQADCLFRSAGSVDGSAEIVSGSMPTIMAGLACGEPSSVSWPLVRDHADILCSVEDRVAADGMRILAAPLPDGDPRIVSGESGAVGAGLLYAIMQDAEHGDLRKALGLDSSSRVLLISTEGDTSPDIYRRIVWLGSDGR